MSDSKMVFPDKDLPGFKCLLVLNWWVIIHPVLPILTFRRGSIVSFGGMLCSLDYEEKKALPSLLCCTQAPLAAVKQNECFLACCCVTVLLSTIRQDRTGQIV